MPEGVVEIVAPDGVHVVDHVTHTWLPRAPRPFVVDDPDHAKLHLRALSPRHTAGELPGVTPP